MQSDVAQIIALVSYGNVYFDGKLSDDYFSKNNTFRFCKSITFYTKGNLTRLFKPTLHSKDPLEWFRNIQHEGCKKLQVRYSPNKKQVIPDRLAAAIRGGSGKWSIEAHHHDKYDIWEAEWDVGNNDKSSEYIFDVRYEKKRQSMTTPTQNSEDISSLICEMTQILESINEFSIKHGFFQFSDCFQHSLNALKEGPADDEKGFIMLPDGYGTLDNHRLLSACQRSSVFGGIGSWNDIEFRKDEDQAQYENLSDKLYDTMIRSLVSCANTH